MAELRRSTVYDYSDLRLHPDGTRVHQMDQNLRPKAAQIAVQAARSNWIARDAAGFATVQKHRSLKQAAQVEEEDASMRVEGDQNEIGNDSEGADSETSVNPRKRRHPDHRKSTFRKKFVKNEDYLVEEASPSILAPSEFGEPFLPNPPPDLLKCIHRFASEFYTERGQLLNSSKLYRQERKARKEKRRARLRKQETGDNRDSSSSSPSSYDSSQSEGEEEEGVCETGSTGKGAKGKQSKRRRLIGDLYTDMYKVFDGSAMMALGMLVQEHVAHMLTPRIPETWESEVRSTYSRPWGDSQPLYHTQGHSGDGQPAKSVTTPNVNGGGLCNVADIHQDVEIEDEEDEARRTSELDHVDTDSNSDDDSLRSADTKHTSSEDESC